MIQFVGLIQRGGQLPMKATFPTTRHGVVEWGGAGDSCVLVATLVIRHCSFVDGATS